MKYTLVFIIFVFSGQVAGAQRTITFDPTTDIVALRKNADTIEMLVHPEALALSVRESIPGLTSVDSVRLIRLARSGYLLAYCRSANSPESAITLAILLAETAAGTFYTDQLVISCSSTGNCRECSLTPACACVKGSGSCEQSVRLINLKKVTLYPHD